MTADANLAFAHESAGDPGSAAKVVLEARDIVKELGHGARMVRALKVVNLDI